MLNFALEWLNNQLASNKAVSELVSGTTGTGETTEINN